MKRDLELVDDGDLTGMPVYIHTYSDGLFKLLVVGQSNVGKTSLCFQYVDGVFDDNMLATIGIDFVRALYTHPIPT